MALSRRGDGDARAAAWCSTARSADTSIDALAQAMVGRRVQLGRAQRPRPRAARRGAPLLQAQRPAVARCAGRAAPGRRVADAARRRDRRHRRRLGQRTERAARRAVGPARAATPARCSWRGRHFTPAHWLDPPTRARARRWPTCPKTASAAAWCCPSRPGSRRCSATSAAALRPPRLDDASAAMRDDTARDDGALRRAPARPALRSSSSPAATSRSWCWRARRCPSRKVLLVGQPTRGVDIGAIEFIHGRLRAMRDAGGAVLVVSSELDEILALADRVLVMNAGRISRRAADRRSAPRPRWAA